MKTMPGWSEFHEKGNDFNYSKKGIILGFIASFFLIALATVSLIKVNQRGEKFEPAFIFCNVSTYMLGVTGIIIDIRRAKKSKRRNET
jgi:hypothetical protein